MTGRGTLARRGLGAWTASENAGRESAIMTARQMIVPSKSSRTSLHSKKAPPVGAAAHNTYPFLRDFLNDEIQIYWKPRVLALGNAHAGYCRI